MVSSHSLILCRLITNWVLVNKRQWKLKQQTELLILGNALKMPSAKWLPFIPRPQQVNILQRVGFSLALAYALTLTNGKPLNIIRLQTYALMWVGNLTTAVWIVIKIMGSRGSSDLVYELIMRTTIWNMTSAYCGLNKDGCLWQTPYSYTFLFWFHLKYLGVWLKISPNCFGLWFGLTGDKVLA